MIKVKELMVLERLLLEIEARFKFKMNFGDAFKLYELLKTVGRITNYAFYMQDEYHKKYNDTEKLKEYHEMVMDSEIPFEYEETIKFIEYVSFKFKDEEFENIILKNKFWE
jgi:hypothetical protein